MINYKYLLTGTFLGCVLTACGPIKFFGVIAGLYILTIISFKIKAIKA